MSSASMKVALVNSFFLPHEVGGVEVAVRRLAESLAGCGVEVVVVATTAERALERDRVGGLCVVRVPVVGRWALDPAGPLTRLRHHLRDRWNLAMARRVAAVLADERVDLVHTHNLIGLSPAVWHEAAQLGVPVVHTLHDQKLLCPRGTAGRRDGWPCGARCGTCQVYTAPYVAASRTVAAVASVSDFILRRHLEAGYFAGVAAHVIGNAVAERTCSRDVRPPAAPPLRVGYLGRLAPEKGVADLLGAIATLHREGLEIELLVAGSGSLRPALERQARGLPVTFLGRVPPEALFERIHVLAVPSRGHEAFGLVAIEAPAAGVPVLASARGGLRELVAAHGCGWIYEPAEAGALAAALRRLATDGIAPEVLARGRSAAPRFRPAAIAGAYLEVYRAALGRAARPSAGAA